MNVYVVVPWVRDAEIAEFLKAWNITRTPKWLLLQRDVDKDGCGRTKNKGITKAIEAGADVVVVLDGDCYPAAEAPTLEALIDQHVSALKAQPVELFQTVTAPPSRGTPYFETTIDFPVAASVGFWHEVPDYCAVRQLAFAAAPMTYDKRTIFGRYFPLCGMNIAFKPNDWLPWCRFINVSRFDDIWMGWLWQKEAYRRGYCFNLAGPMVRHARQSNVWRNLIDEAKHLESSETLWRTIAMCRSEDYSQLLKLLPAGFDE